MARIAALFTLLVALLGVAPWLVPVAKQSVRLVAARDDPAAIADLGLDGLDATTLAREMEAALVDNDITLATSYLALADARGLAVAPDLRARIDQANTGPALARRAAREFGIGFVTGQPQDLAGLAGAAAGDFMVWGDIRDATRETLKYAAGEQPDRLILGLSAVGLALTAGTYATVGASLPVRAGLSLVKVAKRTGRLSVPLSRALLRNVNATVDFTALRHLDRRLSHRPESLDKAAMKGVVRADGLKRLARMMDDVGTIQAKAGTRAALESLRVADSGRDLSRIARLAEARGGQTLAILKSLGRGAVMVTGALLKLVWWGAVALAYLYALVSAFNAFCVACARSLWRGKGRRPQGAAADEAAPGETAAPAPSGVVTPEPARKARPASGPMLHLVTKDGRTVPHLGSGRRSI